MKAIHELVGKNKIEQALALLASLAPADQQAAVSIIQADWKNLSQQQIIGILSFNEANRQRNIIIHRILELSAIIASKPTTVDPPTKMQTNKAYKAFLSYARKNQFYFDVFKDRLETHIKHSGVQLSEIWVDEDIPQGTDWDATIKAKLEEVDLAILLVSPDFLASDYIKNTEFEAFLRRSQAGELLLFPVYLEPCEFTQWLDLSKIQFFMPRGADYGLPQHPQLTFSDLVQFHPQTGSVLPNPKRERYFVELVKELKGSIAHFEQKRPQ